MPLAVTGLTTTGLASGDVGYLSAANTMSKTDAIAIGSSRAYGVNSGTVGSMDVDGALNPVKFTTAGGSPNAGDPVYLAPSTEEAGAAGKLTATAPSTAGQFIAQVGICQSNANYIASKTCIVLWQPKAVIAI